jgi:hypothetical protein
LTAIGYHRTTGAANIARSTASQPRFTRPDHRRDQQLPHNAMAWGALRPGQRDEKGSATLSPCMRRGESDKLSTSIHLLGPSCGCRRFSSLSPRLSLHQAGADRRIVGDFMPLVTWARPDAARSMIVSSARHYMPS